MWKAAFAVTISSACLVFYFKHKQHELRKTRWGSMKLSADDSLTSTGQNFVSPPALSGAQSYDRPGAKIGTHFSLINQDGDRIRTSVDFAGKWMLVYFGFTHCPDVCPEELEKISKVLERLRRNHQSIYEKLAVFFVTCDPQRDGPEQLKQYLKDFHPKIVGVTGSFDEVMQVAKKFRVYFKASSTVEEPSKKEIVGDGSGDYIVDHTTITYLLNEKGDFVRYFGKSTRVEEFVDALVDGIAKTNNSGFSRLKKWLAQ